MKYVNQMGCLYKMSDVEYRRMLRLVASGGTPWDVLQHKRSITNEIVNVTDMGKEEAQDRLNDLNGKS